MAHEERLAAGIANADVLDIAGRILANPDRAMVSQADKIALALVLERTWAVALEADLLVRWLLEPESERRSAALQEQLGILVPLLSLAIRRPRRTRQTPQTEQERADGSRHS